MKMLDKRHRDKARIQWLRKIIRDKLSAEGYDTEPGETTTGTVKITVQMFGEPYNITITKGRS